MNMNEKEHRERHIELHDSLDELLADAIKYAGLLPSKATILDLLRWSHTQTIKPSLIEKNQEVHIISQ
jgi:hypothetical protein